MSVPYEEMREPLDEYSTLCRGCLASSGEMKNIYEWGIVDDFFDCTGLPNYETEGVSQLLCSSCERTMIICKQWRALCRNTHYVLEAAARKRQFLEPVPTPNARENTVSCNINSRQLTIMISAPNMEVKVYLPCPYCPASYIKHKDLMLHLTRVHHISNRNFEIQLQYYCSVESCSYFINSGTNKFFQGRKFLNQHYQKVHADMKFICKDCQHAFPTAVSHKSHVKYCNRTFVCEGCEAKFPTNERLLVHLKRKHPEEHSQYKRQKKLLKRKSSTVTESKIRSESPKDREMAVATAVCDSPMRSSSTQTKPEDNIKNDVTLPSWMPKSDAFESKTDEISTQTGFEDLLSLKSQASEDDSIFFSETVSLSDIQTQTFPIDFGSCRSNKETLTNETQSPDLSIKETQTCFCLYESPKASFKMFDSVTSSPCSLSLASTETQTHDRMTVKSDVLLSFNSAQTQTSFEEFEKDTF